MTIKEANSHLAEICVQYLINNEDFIEFLRYQRLTNWGSKYKSKVEDYLRHHPFLYYAVEGWASHLLAVGSPSSTLFQLALAFLGSPERRGSIMQLTYFINYQGSLAVPFDQQPIHLAAYLNFPCLVAFYISQDQKVIHAVCDSDDTPLIWASEMGSTACVKMLLEAGADPNKFEYDGWSALHWAARNGHVEIAKMLIDLGAILEQHDNRGHTPLEWAMDREHWEVVDALKERVSRRGLAKYNEIMSERFLMGRMNTAQRSMNVGRLRDYRQ